MARPKKVVEEKKNVEPIATPSKVVNVVFTIPTAFSYESVKVEYSGLADTNEIVEKYNELVDTFRPKPKPAPVKEPFKPYTVPRKVQAHEDEAGGHMDEAEKTIALQKQDIAELLKKNHDFDCTGKPRAEIEAKVMTITGLVLAESNFEDIIDKLK